MPITGPKPLSQYSYFSRAVPQVNFADSCTRRFTHTTLCIKVIAPKKKSGPQKAANPTTEK